MELPDNPWNEWYQVDFHPIVDRFEYTWSEATQNGLDGILIVGKLTGPDLNKVGELLFETTNCEWVPLVRVDEPEYTTGSAMTPQRIDLSIQIRAVRRDNGEIHVFWRFIE
ncbi:MAG: hypothetical protein U9Q67_00820 [Patescibacteria group bacterium]|nr:hypothetical protein [Patescibacteria group bacterium]